MNKRPIVAAVNECLRGMKWVNFDSLSTTTSIAFADLEEGKTSMKSILITSQVLVELEEVAKGQEPWNDLAWLFDKHRRHVYIQWLMLASQARRTTISTSDTLLALQSGHPRGLNAMQRALRTEAEGCGPTKHVACIR